MRTATVILALCAVPVAGFSGGYVASGAVHLRSGAREASQGSIDADVPRHHAPHCIHGHIVSMDGTGCTDWQVVEDGLPTRPLLDKPSF